MGDLGGQTRNLKVSDLLLLGSEFYLSRMLKNVPESSGYLIERDLTTAQSTETSLQFDQMSWRLTILLAENTRISTRSTEMNKHFGKTSLQFACLPAENTQMRRQTDKMSQ